MAPSERALSPQATEGETNNLTATKSQALSPHALRGSHLAEGAFHTIIPQTRTKRNPQKHRRTRTWRTGCGGY